MAAAEPRGASAMAAAEPRGLAALWQALRDTPRRRKAAGLGIALSLIGAPFFGWLLVRMRKGRI